MSIPLKLLVDVGVGKAIENWLRLQGHDVLAGICEGTYLYF